MQEYDDDTELMSFEDFLLYYDYPNAKTFDFLNVGDWTVQHVQSQLTQGYDYQNLYDPGCATAIYYFLETIDLDFSNMDEDDAYLPFGWFDFYAFCAKIGVVIPGQRELGKYGASLEWA